MAVPAVATAEAVELEREYRAHRDAVLAMLRADFRLVGDHEELYQEAWTEILERRAAGKEIRNLRALLKLVAWRRARDLARNRSAAPTDPSGWLLESQRDPGPAPDEHVEVHLDAARIRRVVETLDERHAAIIKLRFDLGFSSAEIQEVLGVSRKRLEKLVTEAYSAVEEQLVQVNGHESPWTRRQRSLLLSCLVGFATDAQRERARQMVAEDPACRAMLRQMRAALDQTAAVLPVPVMAADQHREHGLALLDRVHDGVSSLRDFLANAAARANPTSSAVEPAAGGIATVGSATALKAAVVCISLGGGTAVCIESGVFRDEPAKPKQAERTPRQTAPKEEIAVRAVSPPRPKQTTPRTPAAKPRPKVTSAGPAAPSPVPDGSTEFGPGAIGSAAASSTPAAAPSDGGGEFTP